MTIMMKRTQLNELKHFYQGEIELNFERVFRAVSANLSITVKINISAALKSGEIQKIYQGAHSSHIRRVAVIIRKFKFGSTCTP